MKYLSLFSGIGGFELGIQQSYEDLSIKKKKKQVWQKDEKTIRVEESKINNERDSGLGNSRTELQQHNINNTIGQPTCIGYSEIDKYACQIYDKQFNHKNYGDITKIIPRELPDFDLLVGGFPCQAFSIAGKRKGFDDTRGTLFFDIARICSEKRPKYLVLENVKGLLSHDKGQTFQTILGVLSDLGYAVEWQVLNSKNFGVPQNRERVFIVGYFGGFPRRKVFPITESNGKIGKDIKILAHKDCYRRANQVYDRDGSTETLSTCGGGGQHPCTFEIIDKKGKSKNKDYASTLTGGGHSGGNHSDMDLLVTGKIENPLKGKTQYGWHFEQGVYDEKGISRSIKAGEGSGNKPKLLKDTKIRRLTPKECERLQGFPDDWTDGLSDTQRYKTLGNAVTVNVIKEIFKRLYG